MKKFCAILITFILFGCGIPSSPYLKEHYTNNMTLNEFKKLVEADGHRQWRYSEYKGYKLIGWNKFGIMPTYTIFDPDDHLIKYMEYNDESKELIWEEDREKYLKIFVAKQIGVQDYSDIYEFSPYIAAKVEKRDLLTKDYQESSKKLENRFNEWMIDYNKYQEIESACLQSLSDSQLELLAAYEDATKNNESNAKIELYRRKLTRSLNPNQMDLLTKVATMADDLNNRKADQIKEENRLKALYEEIAHLNHSIKADLATESSHLSAERAYERANMQAFTNSLNQMGNDLKQQSYQLQQQSYQQQQQFQMRQMNNSLQDISRAIRGY